MRQPWDSPGLSWSECLADPRGVRADEVALQLRELVLVDDGAGELAESGGDAVDDAVLLHQVVDDLPRLGHLLHRFGRQLRREVTVQTGYTGCDLSGCDNPPIDIKTKVAS